MPIRTGQLYLIRSQQPISVDGPCVFAPPGRKDVAPIALSIPVNWNMDPYHDRNWCAQLHMWRMMDDYLLRYEKSGDASWLREPLALIEDYALYHVAQEKRSRYEWKDMLVGLRAMKLAYLMSLHQDGKLTLTSRQLEACSCLIHSHAAFLSNQENVRYSNHTFIDVHGAMALYQVTEGATRAALKALVDQVVPPLLAAQFSPGGAHLENSAKYQVFGLGCLRRLQASGWFGAYHVDALYRRAERIKDWLRLTDGRLVPVGDTAGAKPPGGSLPADYLGEDGVLNESGYVVVRAGGADRDPSQASYLFLMGAYNSIFHKHQDDLSVVWYEGQDILCDAGQYAYKSDANEKYVLSTRAHNTVTIDGANHYPSTAHDTGLVYGSAVRSLEQHGTGIHLISARVDHAAHGTTHRRGLLYRPGSWLAVFDEMISHESHSYAQWFHFCPTLELRHVQGGRYETRLNGERRLTVMSTATAELQSELVRGQTQPQLQGWISRGYREMEPADALTYVCSGRRVAWVTLFVLNDDGSACCIDGNGVVSLDIRCSGEPPSRSRWICGDDDKWMRLQD